MKDAAEKKQAKGDKGDIFDILGLPLSETRVVAVPEAVPVPLSKLPLIILLCAFAVPVLTGFLGSSTSDSSVCNERTGDSFTSCSYDKFGFLHIERIFSDDIEPVSGDFSWRYFQRGIIEGARLSRLRIFFRPLLGDESGDYADRLLNPLNPTPFLITVFILLASLMIKIYEIRQLRSEGVSGPSYTLRRCDGCGKIIHSTFGLQAVEGKGDLCATCSVAIVPLKDIQK
jgi:hypothetical protein